VRNKEEVIPLAANIDESIPKIPVNIHILQLRRDAELMKVYV
jgi:hypothetical protein